MDKNDEVKDILAGCEKLRPRSAKTPTMTTIGKGKKENGGDGVSHACLTLRLQLRTNVLMFSIKQVYQWLDISQNRSPLRTLC